MPVAITNVASPAGVSATGNVATYSGVSIGVADNNRIVVLHVGSELVNASPNSATVDSGSGAVDMIPGALANIGAVYARCFYAHVPSGTTAEFAITFGANPSNTQNHIAVDRVVDANIVPASTGQVGDTDADPITTGAVTIPTDGGMVAVCVDATDTTARTWTGITESLDEDAGSFRFSTGISTTAGTPTVTVSGGNNEDGAISWIIFNEGAQFSPSLYDDTDSFFAPTVAATADIAPSLFDDTDSLFAPFFSVELLPSLYTDAESFFAPTVDLGASTDNIDPSLYTDAEQFFAPTVSATADIAPSLFDDADQFFAAFVSVELLLSLYDDADQFFAPTVTTVTNVSPSLYDDADQFFSPTVSAGAVDVAPSLYDDTDSLFMPFVSVELLLSLHDDTDQFFAPVVTTAGDVAPSLYDDTDQFFAPTVIAEGGSQNVSPLLMSDADSFFAPALTSTVDAAPSLYDDTDQFFAPTLSVGAVDVAPSLYTDADSFFAPTVMLADDQDIDVSLHVDVDVIFQPAFALVGGGSARSRTAGVGRFGTGDARQAQLSTEARGKPPIIKR